MRQNKYRQKQHSDLQAQSQKIAAEIIKVSCVEKTNSQKPRENLVGLLREKTLSFTYADQERQSKSCMR